MKRTFQYGEETISLEVTPEGEGFRVRLPDGTEQVIQARRLADGRIEIVTSSPPSVSISEDQEGLQGSRVLQVPLSHPTKDTTSLWWHGETYTVSSLSEGGVGRTTAKRHRSGTLTAPMVGVVAAVHVSPGDTVTAYQALVVIEAMKVLATLEAPFAGVVQSVAVRKGDHVEHGAVLVEITPQSETKQEATP